MFINQFAEHDGAGTAIKSPPLRFSKGLNTGGIVTIHKHNIDDVNVLLLTLMHPLEALGKGHLERLQPLLTYGIAGVR